MDMDKRQEDKRQGETWAERIDRWAASDAGSTTMAWVFCLLLAAAAIFGWEG